MATAAPVQNPMVVITGRQKMVFIPHPTIPGKRVPQMDKSPMVVTYRDRRHLLSEAGKLQGVLGENPNAQAEVLKPGETLGMGLKLSLGDWIKQASATPLPADAVQPSPAPVGELDDVVFPPAAAPVAVKPAAVQVSPPAASNPTPPAPAAPAAPPAAPASVVK